MAVLKSICTILASCPLSNALYSACDMHKKCITVTQTFPISKLGGWKPSNAFHKSSVANQHQALKHLRQYRCYGNCSVVGNTGGWWTLWNRGDIGLSSASRETTRRTRHRNTTPRRAGRTSAVLLRKRGNILNGSEPP